MIDQETVAHRCSRWEITDPVEVLAVHISMEYDEAARAWKPDILSLPTELCPKQSSNWPHFLKAGETLFGNRAVIPHPEMWVLAQFAEKKPEVKWDCPRPWDLHGRRAWDRYREYVSRRRQAIAAKEIKAEMDAEENSASPRLVVYECMQLKAFTARKQNIEMRVGGKFMPLRQLLAEGWLLESSVPSSAFHLNEDVFDLAPWRACPLLAGRVYRALGVQWMKKNWGEDFRPHFNTPQTGK